MSLRIQQTVNERDTTRLEIVGADEGVFLLAFLKPGTTGANDEDFYFSGNITAGGPSGASSLKSAIRDYYRMSSVAGTDPNVKLVKCRNNDTIEIDCDSETEEIRDYIYDIIVPRSISKPSCTQIMPVPIDTGAWITVHLPSDEQGSRSQAPLAGTYIIKCYELDGFERYTSPIKISHDNRAVYDAISNACPNLRGRFSVTQNKDVGCEFNQDCIVWDLKFSSVYGELNQFEVLSNDGYIPEQLGYGNDPLRGKNVTIS